MQTLLVAGHDPDELWALLPDNSWGRVAASAFAKAGIARLQTDVTTVAGCTPSTTCLSEPVFFRQNQTDNRFAYGVGVQSKAWGFAFRAEYERISSQFGDPDALTVSATWSF